MSSVFAVDCDDGRGEVFLGVHLVGSYPRAARGEDSQGARGYRSVSASPSAMRTEEKREEKREKRGRESFHLITREPFSYVGEE
jgi:hypothetical protein